MHMAIERERTEKGTISENNATLKHKAGVEANKNQIAEKQLLANADEIAYGLENQMSLEYNL